jgi:glutathione synthase
MKVLFVMDPLERIQVAGDSTYMLMLEAQRRGWEPSFCTPSELYALGGEGRALATSCSVSGEAPYFHGLSPADVSLGHFQLIWMRKDPPFDMDYVFSTYILDLVPRTTLVVNRPSSIRSANEKMFALQWSEHCPETLVTREIERAICWASLQPDRVVIKPWDGNGGRGVLVSHHKDPNFRSMLEILTAGETRYILVQRYIPEILDGDKRIILVDGDPVGWMLRVPQPGDHRGNMHVGARVASCELDSADLEICRAIGPRLRELGLLFVGIDTIGGLLTEINVTSPTGIREINPMMGISIERIITDSAERLYHRHTSE